MADMSKQTSISAFGNHLTQLDKAVLTYIGTNPGCTQGDIFNVFRSQRIERLIAVTSKLDSIGLIFEDGYIKNRWGQDKPALYARQGWKQFATEEY